MEKIMENFKHNNKEVAERLEDRNFTTFFHPFHKLPSTFSTIKQALKL